MVVEKYLLTVVSILILLFVVNPIFAQVLGEERSWIDASFEFDFVNATFLHVRLEFDIHDMTIYGREYYADGIRSIYDREGAAFRSKIFDFADDILNNHVFKKCNIYLDIPYADSSSLIASEDSDPYNPPVVIYIDGKIALSSSFFNSNIKNINDVVNGLIDVGGKVYYNFDFFCPSRWNITYKFVVPKHLTVKEVKNGDLSLDGRSVTWQIQNWKDENNGSLRGLLCLSKENLSSLSHHEDINANISFDMGGVEYTYINISLNVKSLNLSGEVNIPEFINIGTLLPSDAIRLLASSSILSWKDVYDILYDRADMFETNFLTSLDKNISFYIEIDNSTTSNCSQAYDIEHMDSTPPIKIRLRGKVKDLLDSIPTKALLGIIYDGGKINITTDLLNLNKIGYPFNASISLPYGKTYRWNSKDDLNITLSLYSREKWKDRERIDRFVEIDLSDIDLDLIDFFTGKSDVVSSMNIRDNYLIYRISPSLLISLPRWIDLHFADSDLVRLLIEEGMINDSRLNKIFGERVNSSRDLISLLTGINNMKVYINKRGFEDSLRWKGDIDKINDSNPINIPSFASVSKKARFTFSIVPLSLKIINGSIECTPIPGENVTYRLIFPKGVKVRYTASLGRIERGYLDNGREYIDINFYRNDTIKSTTIYYSLDVQPLMMLFIFMPLLIIILILVGITGIIVVMRKRRRYRVRVYEKKSDEKRDEFR